MAKTVKTDKPFVVFSAEADKDYLLARAMNLAGGPFHGRAGYHSHQACEKYLKALLVQAESQYLETHILSDLADRCEIHHSIFKDPQVRADLELFDGYEQVGRYGAAANFDPKAQKAGAIITAGVMMWSANYIQRLDDLIHKTRSLLDFSPFPGMDGLKAIHNRQKKNLLGQGWQLKPPLRVILTKNNKVWPPL